MGRGGHIPEEILLSPDNPRLAGYEPVSGQDDDRYTPYVHYTVYSTAQFDLYCQTGLKKPKIFQLHSKDCSYVLKI